VIDPDDAVVVMQGPAHEVQRVAERFTDAGIECAILGPPEDAEPGRPRADANVRLAVAGHNVEQCREIFELDWRSGLDPDQLAAADAASRIVIDPESPETTCPACLTTFATGPTTCPECGLTIG
jgi:hypothetical protein